MTRLDAQEQAITERVMRAREDLGMTKTEFAEKLGLSKQGYQPYEKYRAPFSISQLFQISRILERPVAYFLGLDTGLTGREERALMLFRLAEQAGYGDVVIGAIHAMVTQLLAPSQLDKPVGNEAQ
jgi:transcriptional regulator with XRE-family HTH domain